MKESPTAFDTQSTCSLLPKETVKLLHDGEKGSLTKDGGGNWGSMVMGILEIPTRACSAQKFG
jgi:hypothetical protein